LASENAAQFLEAWKAAPSDQDKDNLEQEAVSRSPTQDFNVQIQPVNAGVGGLVEHQSEPARLNARFLRLTHLPDRLRQRYMVLQTWIVSGL
jgi:hypothetical protein